VADGWGDGGEETAVLDGGEVWLEQPTAVRRANTKSFTDRDFSMGAVMVKIFLSVHIHRGRSRLQQKPTQNNLKH
jgi:hypothetical protein